MTQTAPTSDEAARKAIIGGMLVELAEQRMRQGLAPPPEIYRIEYRRLLDWPRFPDWARPIDPQIFDGCVHEG
jgi:hypothetical protein